jgi:sigma-B regulation protein RsbU (phosphoserine phosphatase)
MVEFGSAIWTLLIVLAIVFAAIELIALIVGVGLTRTMTRSVAELYGATQHINRGDLKHRIKVQAQDQLAALEGSFNSMSESLEKLIAEQKEKQRLENELAIAQEVQAQLFPQAISDLESLEVHGVCRPARTVSGDYYDFLPYGPDRLGIAVGDISGKGISAALLMATIHSAVRAYEFGRMPMPTAHLVAAGGRADTAPPIFGGQSASDGEFSPARVLGLLNRQLYHSTPAEKYATLFLSVYDGRSRAFTYSNAGHLPPIILGNDGSLRRLDTPGLVIGLFDDQGYEERTIDLRPGDIFLAFSDGVTEPENEFGEFGEERLIDIVRDHRHLPLARISEMITSAVSDWIGANEQPDDVTVVLARAR